MALDSTERLILISILGILMAFIVYFELKVMRRKSAEVRAASIKKDEAFNAVLTTRTVLNTVRNRGGHIGSAPALLDRAKDAMNRGFYDSCIELCEKARNELTMGRPPQVQPPEEVEDEDARQRLEAVAESIVTKSTVRDEGDSYTGTKLEGPGEGNYLGAKFEISAAKADVSRAVNSGKETAVADGLMAEAESAFSAGKYDRALSLAVRARRSLNTASGDEAIPLSKAEEQASVEGEDTYEVRDEAAKAPTDRICPDCGAVVEKGDKFCPICGSKVQTGGCPSCGAKQQPDDKFCRKCGFKIG